MSFLYAKQSNEHSKWSISFSYHSGTACIKRGFDTKEEAEAMIERLVSDGVSKNGTPKFKEQS